VKKPFVQAAALEMENVDLMANAIATKDLAALTVLRNCVHQTVIIRESAIMKQDNALVTLIIMEMIV